jgi:adenosylcobinamide-GDP ribazoletransferase
VSAARDGVRSAIAALSFLTAIPVGRRAAIADADLRTAVALFPAVGALVGGVVATVAWGAAMILPQVPAAVLAVAAGVIVTGAFHLDGLADTADGVGAALSGRDPGEVMADPRLGTFGGAALVLDLLLKTSVVSGLIITGGFPWAIVAAGTLGRMSILALALAIDYAGPEDGAGPWTRALDRRRCLAGLGTGAAIVILAVGVRSLAMAGVAAIVCLVVARWSSRHLAGMRGDTFGAAAELTETLGLAAVLAAS